MLPHNHFLIASLIIAIAGIVFFSELSLIEIGKWILTGALLSAAIDLDVYVLAVLKSKKMEQLKPFKNPIEMYRKFETFMDVMTKTGVLRTVVKTHIISSVLVIVAFYLFFNAYLIPVVLGVLSHLISDIPSLRKVMR